MTALTEKLRQGGWLIVLCVVLTAALVWFAGPYLAVAGHAPLSGRLARLLFLLLLAVVVGGIWLVRYSLKRRRAARMASDLGADGAGSSSRSASERRHLESRFQEALQLLRRRPGRNNLYTLPWYAVIGPPGSGKTTLLQHAGLTFPLADRYGKESVRGIGGTRQCDWWFTDEGVFLDTAGRYTTQDSDRSVDAAGWRDFLQLLGKHRPQRPLNGVLVAMSLSDLLNFSPAEREAHASAIRERLDELQEHLHLRVPVYLVLTKCDLLSGFSEFFDDLNAAQRGQVWGTTFALEKSLSAQAAHTFDVELQRLLDRLNTRVMQRLHDERDSQRRAQLLAFPLQFGALGDVLRGFVAASFGAQATGTAPMLRGVYFTSGTQEGSPIDRMLGAVSRSFGLAPQQVAPATAAPRTFFIETLLRGVVLREPGLAGFSPERTRRRRLLQTAACCAAGLLATVWVAGLLGSYQGNRDYLTQVAKALHDRPATPSPSGADDLHQYYALSLQHLQGIDEVMAVARPPAKTPWSHTWGLYQRSAIHTSLAEAKRRQANALLVPGMAAQLRQGLKRTATEPQALYYYLKGYLMLGNPAKLDTAQLRTLIGLDAAKRFGDDRSLAKTLEAQLASLDALPGAMRVISPEPVLVDQARNTLRSSNLATLVYSQLQLAVQSGGPSSLRLDRALGLLSDIFQRRSGIPLSEPLPALYTRTVFADMAQKGIDSSVDQFVNDDWVMGEQRMDSAARARMASDVLALYEQDYIRAWDALLGDLQVTGAASAGDPSATLAAISGPGSPLRLMLSLLSDQTQNLLRADDADKTTLASAAEAAVGDAVKDAGSALSQTPLLGAILNVEDDSQADPPGQRVSEHFAALADLGDGGAGTGQLDQVLAVFQQLGQQMLVAGRSPATSDNSTLLQARQLATQLPVPVAGWLLTLTGQSGKQLTQQATLQLDAQIAQSVGQVCAPFVNNRYPFDPSASNEIPLQNFSELFGYGGHFDNLYNQSLSPLLDTTGGRWRWKEGDMGVASDAALPLRMQRADVIKRTYFRGSDQPQVGFTVLAPQLGDDIARLDIDIDGQHYDYREGAAPSMPMKWPGPVPGRVSLTAFDANGKRLGGVVYLGDWALFRALQSARVEPESDVRYTATFDLDGHMAQLPLQAANLRHPFDKDGLAGFRCGS